MEWNHIKDNNMADFRNRLEHDGATLRQPLLDYHDSRDIVPNKSSQLVKPDNTQPSTILHSTKLFTSTTYTPSIFAPFAHQQDILSCGSSSDSETSSTNSHGFGSGFCETKNLENQIKNLELTTDPFGDVNKMQETLSGIQMMTEQLYQQNEDGDTNLHLAILDNNTAYLGDILENTFLQQCLDIQNKRGQTPLHLSIILGHLEIVRTLLACGVSLIVQDTEGRTPLHIACEKGDLESVRALTKPLENWELKSAENMLFAVEPQNTPQPCYLTNFEGETCVHVAAKKGRFDIVEYLVDHCGHNINAQEVKSGKTILHTATDTEDEDMLKFLLHHKNIDPYVEDYNGHSALLLAHFHPKSLAALHTVFPHLREILEEKFEEMEADEAVNTTMNGY